MYYGKIKFFDDHKNHFGFIKKIIPPISEEAIFISESDVKCDPSLLEDNVEVVFEIRNTKAYNLDLLANSGVAQKKSLARKIVGVPLHKIAYDLIKDEIDLSKREKIQICNNIIKSPVFSSKYDSYELIKAFNLDYYINNIIPIIKGLSDSKKLDLLNKHDELIKYICNSWRFENRAETNKLLLKLKNSQIDINSLDGFIYNLNQNLKNLTVKNILLLYSIDEDSISISDFYNKFNLDNLDDILSEVKTYLNKDKQAKLLLQLYDCIIENKINIPFEKSFKILENIYKIKKNNKIKNMINKHISNSNIDNFKDFLKSLQFYNSEKTDYLREKLIDYYFNLKKDLSNRERLVLMKNSEDELLEIILKDWNAENSKLNNDLVNEIIHSDKYFNFRHLLKTVIKKMIDCDLKNIPENQNQFTIQKGAKLNNDTEIPF